MQPFRVGDWTAYPKRDELEGPGEKIRIEPRVMQVLVALAKQPDEVVTRKELLETIWNGTFVSDEVLTNAVRELRKALADDAKSPRYIQTLPKKGYRLVAPVQLLVDRKPGNTRTWLAIATGVLASAGVALLAWGAWRSDGGSSPGSSTRLRLSEIVLEDGRRVNDGEATVSSDGRLLAYYDWEQDGLAVYDLQSGESGIVVPAGGSWVAGYRWSPNRRQLVYGSARGHDYVVDIVDLDTSERRELYRDGRAEILPVDWLGHGAGIWCRARRDGVFHLVKLDHTGQIVTETRIRGWDVRVAPSGRYAAYSEKIGAKADIYIADLSAGTETSISPSGLSRHNPVWSPDGRYLAFASNRTGEWGLWVTEVVEGRAVGEPFLLDTTIGARSRFSDWLRDDTLVIRESRELHDVWVLPVDPATGESRGRPFIATSLQGKNLQPDWAPDGRRLVFRSGRNRAIGELYVVDLGTRREELLPIETHVQNASWSPRGDAIVFASSPRDRMTLIEHDLVTGSNSTPLVDLPGHAVAAPDYSPDGRMIVVNAYSEDEEKSGLYVLRRGEPPTRIPETSGDVAGRWSPDGRWIAYADERAVWVVHPDGSGRRRVAVADPPDFINGWVSWSPDSRLIVFPKGRGIPGGVDWDAWVAAVDGDETREIEIDERINPWWIAWSPDGFHFALSSVSGATSLWVLHNVTDAIHRH